jgi:hypothetical protein
VEKSIKKEPKKSSMPRSNSINTMFNAATSSTKNASPTKKKPLKKTVQPKNQKLIKNFFGQPQKKRSLSPKKELSDEVKKLDQGFEWELLSQFSNKADKYQAYIQLRHINCPLCMEVVSLAEFKNHSNFCMSINNCQK